MGFVRFVVTRRSEESKLRLGVIKAANELKSVVPFALEAELISLLGWFDKHLPEPGQFSRVRGDAVGGGGGVCWFKDSATEHIARLRPLVAILQEWGEHVERLTTEWPGDVVYEDEFQVVAVPRSGAEGQVSCAEAFAAGAAQLGDAADGGAVAVGGKRGGRRGARGG